MKILYITFTMALCTASSYAAIYDASGKKLPDSTGTTKQVSWQPFAPDNQEDISAVGVLGDYWVGDVCTASLIDSGYDAGPAYILSNGHCNYFAHWGFDFLKVGEVRMNQPTDYHVTFGHYLDIPGVLARKRKKFPFRRIAYITESQTDVAIYELIATLGDLKKQGIQPLQLSKEPPRQGDSVQLVGIPLLFVSDEQKSLHTSSCTLLETVALKNGTYAAPYSVRHQCNSLPGFSGGPLISWKTGNMVLLNSHGSADDARDQAACSYETRPCEISKGGAPPVVREDLNYGQRVDTIAGCFNANGVFDLELRACGLPKPFVTIQHNLKR